MGRSFRFGAWGWIIIIVLNLSLWLLFLLAVSRRLTGDVDLPDGVNILVNGDFEDGTLTPNCTAGVQNVCQPPGPNQQPIPGVQAIPPAELTSVPGWTVVVKPKQDVAWVGPDNPFAGDIASHGHKFIDLSGYADQFVSGSFGGMKQTFNAKAKKRYALFFDIGVFIASSQPAFSGPITVVASIDDQALSPPCSFNPTAPGKQWMTCKYTINASEVATTRTLTIVATAGQRYIGLDNVSVQCLTPLGGTGLCQ